jgi:hypothetical protein
MAFNYRGDSDSRHTVVFYSLKAFEWTFYVQLQDKMQKRCSSPKIIIRQTDYTEYHNLNPSLSSREPHDVCVIRLDNQMLARI